MLFPFATIELSDIVFAVDSVPAIIALTSEPLIVYTSNVLAIIGLMFVGLKMVWLNDWFDGKFPITWSLVIIAALVGGSIAASLVATRHHRRERSGEVEPV